MEQVSLRTLRAVAEVVIVGSITGAAQQLHQSPAAVTRAVQSAEKALGVILFERSARGMLATPAGAALSLRVSRALALLQEAAQGLREQGAPDAVLALPRVVSGASLQALLARAAHPTEAAAAASLGISQPALNQALRKLEHAARTALSERTSRGIRLTDAGEWLLRQARLALAEIRIGLEELARWRGEAEARVVIGSLPMATDVLVPQTVVQALGQRPELRLLVKDGTYEALTRQLRAAEVDFMVGPLRGADLAGDFREELLYVDRFVAVVRAGHPLLAMPPGTSLARLAAYPLIGPLPGTPADAVFQRLFAGLAARRRLDVVLRAHSTAVLRSMLLAGDSVALVSPLQLRAEVQAGLLAYASRPLPGSERPIGITQRRDALASSACAELIEILRRVAREAVD